MDMGTRMSDMQVDTEDWIQLWLVLLLVQPVAAEIMDMVIMVTGTMAK